MVTRKRPRAQPNALKTRVGAANDDHETPGRAYRRIRGERESEREREREREREQKMTLLAHRKRIIQSRTRGHRPADLQACY